MRFLPPFFVSSKQCWKSKIRFAAGMNSALGGEYAPCPSDTTLGKNAERIRGMRYKHNKVSVYLHFVWTTVDQQFLFCLKEDDH